MSQDIDSVIIIVYYCTILCVLQDEHSPPSLLDACLACVCQSLDTLCSVCDDGSLRLHSCPVLPPELSDLLLSTMTDEGKP